MIFDNKMEDMEYHPIVNNHDRHLSCESGTKQEREKIAVKKKESSFQDTDKKEGGHYIASKNSFYLLSKSERSNIRCDAFTDEAVKACEATLARSENNQIISHSEATNLAFETIALLHPKIDEKNLTKFIRGRMKDSIHDLPIEMEMENVCEECLRLEFEAGVNLISFMFDLCSVPYRLARKGAEIIIKALPWREKRRLANIATEYFTEPGNLPRIAKGMKVLSEMLVSSYGDLGTIVSVAFHRLSKKDYAIIAANFVLGVSLLFLSGGTVIMIKLGMKTKAIYNVTNSVMKMQNERCRHYEHDINARKENSIQKDPLRTVKRSIINFVQKSDISITKRADENIDT